MATKSSESRLWILRPLGPAAQIHYIGCAKVADPKWDLGGTEKIECPDAAQAGKFNSVDRIAKANGDATTGISRLYPGQLSELLQFARERCDFDLQVAEGACREKNDYNNGWEKLVAFPEAAFSSWGLTNFGALKSDENAATTEELDVSASEVYEVGQVSLMELAKTTVVRELVSVDVCGAASCGGECGGFRGDCKSILAVMLGTGATPGTLPSVVYSKDYGETWAAVNISSMYSNETPTDSECMGEHFVVAGQQSNSLHYCDTDDLLDGAPVWAENITGFVAGNYPTALWAADAVHLFIAGAGGYVYFASNPGATVQVLTAGSVTTQLLYAIHGYDTLHVVAVGANNAMIKTIDGGTTWETVTGPAAGVALNTVWCWGPETWLVGTASGKLYYTENSGASWTEIVLPITLAAVDSVKFAPDGRTAYLSGRQGAAGGVLLRSTGFGSQGTWKVLPDTRATIPVNDRINDLAVCATNTVYGAGLADDGSDGFLIRGTAQSE